MEVQPPSTEPLLEKERSKALHGSRRCIIAAAVTAAVGIAVVVYWLHPFGGSDSSAALLSCGTKEQCLSVVDAYFDKATRQTYPPRGAGLVQTYGPGSVGGGDCGEDCKLEEPCPNYAQVPHCRFDVYDNALSAIYLAKRGRVEQARAILDAFIALLYPTGDVAPGLDYGAGQLLPSHRSLTLLAAGYTDAPAEAGEYQGVGVADGAVDTGNNAWVGMAFAHYAAATGDGCYALVAHDVLAALVKSTQCADDLQGFGSRLPPYPTYYRSTEHNTDMLSLARMLGSDGGAAMLQARAFVHGMWARLPAFNASYADGTGGAAQCDASVPTAAAAVDAQFWNLLADADPVAARKAASMAFAVQEASAAAPARGLWATDTDRIGGAGGAGRGAVLQGVRFTTWGNGIQWENTASAVMAMAHYRRSYGNGGEEGGKEGPEPQGLGPKLGAARDSLKHLLAAYGCVPASVLGGNIDAYTKNDHAAPYPGGSDTGIGWTYMRYPHAAATAWAGLALMYQFDDADAISDDANPFAPPAAAVPSRGGADAGGRACLPPEGTPPKPAPAGSGGSACAAHPGCAGRHLSGECCPTEQGMLLGCCSDKGVPPASPPALSGAGGGSNSSSRSGPAGQGRALPAACAANPGCASLDLVGDCCPTFEGTMLGCC